MTPPDPTAIGRIDFPDWFGFSRPDPAPVRNVAGAVTGAPAGVPRFDHDEAGVSLGLLVEPGPRLGAADRARLRDDALTLEPGAKATVLHRVRIDGRVERRALYSRDARATVDGLLAQAGHHQAVGVFAGFLPALDGVVRALGQDWRAPALLAAGDGGALGDGRAHPLIGT